VSGGEEQQQDQQHTGDHDESKSSIMVGGGNENLWIQEIHPSYIPTSTSFESNDENNEENKSNKASSSNNGAIFNHATNKKVPSRPGPVHGNPYISV